MINRQMAVFFLALGVLVSCHSAPPQTSVLNVVLPNTTVNQCSRVLDVGDEAWQLDYLGVFLSSLSAQIDGEWQPVPLIVNPWQTQDTVLLKLHDTCSGNAEIVMAWSDDTFARADALRFTIGLPFALNHVNPLIQPSPLNDPTMFWSWQTGHKFIRLDTSSARGSWSFHLGSIGCSAESAMRAPDQPCRQHNRLEVELTRSGHDGNLKFDLNELLVPISLANGSGCMFGKPEETDCERLARVPTSDWVIW